jgi:alpha-D-xyloside xylohydrolase
MGDAKLAIDPGAIRVTFSRGDEQLLDFDKESFALGRVDAVDDATNYDPYALDVPNALEPAPGGLAFLTPKQLSIVKSNATSATVELTYDEGAKATLEFDASAPDRIAVKLSVAAGQAQLAYVRLRPVIDEKEGLYGLGESFDDVNQRGHIRAMQIEINPDLENGSNDAHVPIPFLIGTKGWGLFVDCPYPGSVDAASQDPTRVATTFGTGLGTDKGLTFHLFTAQHPLDITKHYYAVTGEARLPARWALGPWLWRNENVDQAQFEGDLDAMRDLDLPHTGIWIDRPYATGVNTFDYNAKQFTDPKAMIDKAHALGFRFALWHTPYLDEKDPSTQSLRDDANKAGVYPKKVGVLLNKWGKPIDVTGAAGKAFWQAHLKAYTDAGVEGFKLDYGEDIVPGLTSGRNEWQLAAGDERTLHSGFTRFYHATYAEQLPKDGGFLLCRHATWGDQTNGPIIWPGDLDAAFAKRGEMTKDADGKPYVAAGGLPASIVAGLSLGPSGFAFFGSDTGGYIHSPPDKELFTRWFEQTALSTVMQIGNGSSTVAWEPDAKTGFDAEMLDWYRKYTRLHLRLFPYVWSYAKRLAEDGRAIARPLGLAYPDLGAHPNDEYMLGDSLLVAPVIERGATSRKVQFPKGRFVDYWTSEVIEGPVTKDISAPLDTLPLYLTEGAIVPLLRPTIDAIADTLDPKRVDSYATTPGLLYARIVPGPKSDFSLFDGGKLSQQLDQKTLTLEVTAGAELGLGAVLEILGVTALSTIQVDGKALPKAADVAALDAGGAGYVISGKSLWIGVAKGNHTVTITLP